MNVLELMKTIHLLENGFSHDGRLRFPRINAKGEGERGDGGDALRREGAKDGEGFGRMLNQAEHEAENESPHPTCSLLFDPPHGISFRCCCCCGCCCCGCCCCGCCGCCCGCCCFFFFFLLLLF